MNGFEKTRELVEAIARTGRAERGVSRLALTESDREARAIAASEMESLGMPVRTDACCNIWAEYPGTSDQPGVVIGSHLDSVPEGGDYDGVLGVCAGLGVVRDILAENPHPARSLSVVVFTSEESSRFSLATIGSKAATGNLTTMDTLRFKDKNGTTLLKALRDFGGQPEYLSRDALAPASYHSYFELHIEQGPVLDWNSEDVGIVEAIAAPTRFMLDIQGEQAHSGACPMNLRHDALTAAAEIILAVERAGRAESDFGTVATVGVCECRPGAMNVVPGRVTLKVDIRGIVEKSIARAYADVMEKVKKVCAERGVTCNFTLYSADKPVAMDGLLARRVEKSCRELGVKYRRMPSGAGHDAMYMATLIPSALIFVPCKDGVSHSPAETIDWERVRNAKVQRVPLRFAFIKATEGTSIIDENFNENFYQAKRNDIVRGAYHFFVPDVDARKQAQFFMKQVHLEAGDLPPVLDVEKSGRLNPAQLKRAVRTWLDLVEKHYGVKPILYTGYSFKMKYLSDSVFNQYPYWIAHYYVNQLSYQGKWHFWQYTDVGRIDGIEGHVDCNIFGGTLQQLHDLTIKPEEEDEIGLAAETAE